MPIVSYLCNMTLLDEQLIRSNSYLPHIDLYPVVKSLSRMSNISSLRLMFYIHKLTLGKKLVNLPVIEVPITKELLSYLGIEGEDPIASLEYILHQISSSPIPFLRRDKDGRRTWHSPTWLINYKVSEETSHITLYLNPEIEEQLRLLEALSVVRPPSCISLSRTYPLWLYIALTNASLYGDYWVVSAEDFSLISMTEDKNTYRPNKRLSSIPAMLLGICNNPLGREDEKAARKEKRPQKFIPCLFTSRGNLPTLRDKSELMVNVCNIKIKNVISYYAFSFREEDNNGFASKHRSEFSKNLTFAEELSAYELIDNTPILTF